MKYIIMCGGEYRQWEQPRHFIEFKGEPLIKRTIRLLKEAGVEDIAISSTNPMFEGLGVPVLKHKNKYTNGEDDHLWTEAFYPSDEPTCYICGDVFFSPEAIKTIVEADTKSIDFFASAPPFSPQYAKDHAEPFAFKVVNQAYFRHCIDIVQFLYREGHFLRQPIAWELWQVIKKTPINHIDYTNYTAINDYTCDIDTPSDLDVLKNKIGGGRWQIT